MAVQSGEQQADELVQRLRKEDLDRLLVAESGQIDQDLVREFAALPEPEKDVEEYQRQLSLLSQRLGRIEDLPPPTQLEVRRLGGQVISHWRDGSVVNLGAVRLDDPFYGVPALADWACGFGAATIKYQFLGGAEIGAVPEE
ncbi:MAG TPA: hypothetical protein DCY13_04570 [Verrucomicrobiales bacterium]|nr:hypothetical protein [Verrucomicrobiales bacterium]